MKLAIQFRAVIHAGLILALIITVSGCQPATSGRNLSSGMPSLTPRPTVTLVRPTLPASPITITVEPTNTAAPEAPDVGYAPDTRIGIAHLDAIVDAVLANDLARVRDLTHYASVGCTTTAGLGGPPKCQAGESAGMKVEAVPVMGAEGYALRRTDPGVGISAEGYRLMAAIANVEEAIRAEEWWLPAKYALSSSVPIQPGL